MQGSELKKTGTGDGGEEDDEEDDEEEYDEEDEDEDDGDEEDSLPEGNTGSKVMTRRQKAIAEGKS